MRLIKQGEFYAQASAHTIDSITTQEQQLLKQAVIYWDCCKHHYYSGLKWEGQHILYLQ